MGATATLDDVFTATKKNAEDISVITKALGKMRAPGLPGQSDVFGTPWARRGEDPLNSRGFSFLKMLGLVAGHIQQEDAKNEKDIHDRLHKIYGKGLSNGYIYTGKSQPGLGNFLAPLSTSYMETALVDNDFRTEMKSMVYRGMEGADPNEMAWIRRKSMGDRGQKTLSWLNDLVGGAIVAPAEQGELIELLRNKEALVNAGARTVPLPPQGRMKYPRQTMASTTYWVGENAPIAQSDIGTGEVTLQAKKLAVLIRMPNELVRFASPAAEALVRDDMTKSLALGLDLAALEGAGGDHRPRGIINHPNINTVVSKTAGANGDQLVGTDIYRMIAAVEESNAEFEGWIMRPKTLYKYYQLRSDAVTAGDGSGPFLFNLIREAGADSPAMLGGYPVTKSTQVSQVRSKGTASNLTYILGGMFSDILIGMFGAIEFAATTLGDTPFTNDQTWVRGILSADVAIRHEAAMVFMDSLDVVNL